MDIMRPFRHEHTTQDTEAVDDVQFVIVETDEHERVVFQGATQDEVEAKVEDFLTWAS